MRPMGELGGLHLHMGEEKAHTAYFQRFLRVWLETRVSFEGGRTG